MDSPVLWCSLPQILPSFLIYLRNVGFIRHILTHAEYDKDDWKDDEWYE